MMIFLARKRVDFCEAIPELASRAVVTLGDCGCKHQLFVLRDLEEQGTREFVPGPGCQAKGP